MATADGRPRVLFLCTGNSCRSQMAEGFARSLHGDRLEACSAGVDPHGLNPLAIRAMEEAGVDITGHTSDRVEDNDPATLDLVITVCGHANETCPMFPGPTRVVHAGFDDPPALARDAGLENDSDAAMVHYRRVRDEIRAWIDSELPGQLRTTD